MEHDRAAATGRDPVPIVVRDIAWAPSDTELLDRPNARLIARTTPLSEPEEAEIAALQAQLLESLRAAERMDLRDVLDSTLVALFVESVPGVDQPAANRLAELNQQVVQSGGCRCAVVATRH